MAMHVHVVPVGSHPGQLGGAGAVLQLGQRCLSGAEMDVDIAEL